MERTCKRAIHTLTRANLRNVTHLLRGLVVIWKHINIFVLSTRATRIVRRVPQEQRWNNLVTVSISLENSGRRIKPTRNRAISSSPPPAPPEPNLLVPLQTWKAQDEQAKAICNVCEDTRGDGIDCDCKYTETDRSRSTGHFRRMPHDGICQSSPSCHEVNARQIPSAPPGSTSNSKTAKLSATVQCTASRYGPDRLRHASYCAFLAEAAARAVGMSSSSMCRSILAHAVVLTRTDRFSCCLHQRGGRETWNWFGKRIVIPGDRRAQQLWQEHFNKCLSKFGFVPRIADPSLKFSESASAHTSMTRRAAWPQPALNRVLLAIETMLAIMGSGSLTVGQEVRILGRTVERTVCGFNVKPHHTTVTSFNDNCDSNHKHVSQTPAIKDDGNKPGAVLYAATCKLSQSAVGKALWIAFFRADIRFAIIVCVARYLRWTADTCVTISPARTRAHHVLGGQRIRLGIKLFVAHAVEGCCFERRRDHPVGSHETDRSVEFWRRRTPRNRIWLHQDFVCGTEDQDSDYATSKACSVWIVIRATQKFSAQRQNCTLFSGFSTDTIWEGQRKTHKVPPRSNQKSTGNILRIGFQSCYWNQLWFASCDRRTKPL